MSQRSSVRYYTGRLRRLPGLLGLLCFALLTQASYSSEDSSTGSVFITTEPEKSEIVLNGEPTGKTTPATLRDIRSGVHTIEIYVPGYTFLKREFEVIPDTTINLSYKLFDKPDTAYIKGDIPFGVLKLPVSPLPSQHFKVNNREILSHEITLNKGRHRIKWDGKDYYRSLDTTVSVKPGRITFLEFYPQRLYGDILISTEPVDASIYLNKTKAAQGRLDTTLPTGEYHINIKRDGYDSYSKLERVRSDRRDTLRIKLKRSLDRDQDGFPDSIDKCPDIPGYYGGCPEVDIGEEMKMGAKRILENMKSDKFSLTLLCLGLMKKNPQNSDFRKFLSYFNNGDFAFNNLQGLELLNKYRFNWRGFHVEVEFGQWNSGLRYEKDETIPIRGSDIALYYDSIAGVKPGVYIQNTAVSAGLHLSVSRFSASYSLGYRFEDIIVHDLVYYTDAKAHIPYQEYPYHKIDILYDNDHLFHKLGLSFDFLKKRTVFMPRFFFNASFTSGLIAEPDKTGWNNINIGISMDITPGHYKGIGIRKRNIKGDEDEENKR